MTISLDFLLDMWIPSLVVGIILIALLTYLSLKAYKCKVTTGEEGIVGETGVYVGGNKIQIRGEIWRITNAEGLEKGDQVKVLSVHGLLLRVDKFQE
jgi:membrane-bound serine protease (ClpP class)